MPGGEYRLNLFELPDVTFEDFRLGDYFEPYNISGVNTVALSDGDAYDYITRTSINNGVHSKTGIIPSATLQPKGVFSLGLLGMDFFYRDREWYAGQFVRGIKSKEKLSRLSMTYMETILNKVSPELLGVLVRDVDSVFENKIVRLPSSDCENPDFEYMDKYIANIKCGQLLKILRF